MKAVYMDTWSLKEKLCLASAVVQEGDHNWPAVSRLLQPFLESHRPPDWFAEKNCALQYRALLEKVEMPRRKKRSGSEKADAKAETPSEIIKKKLTDERTKELEKLLAVDREQYAKYREEAVLINSGCLDDQLPAMWAEIQEEKRQKEHKAKLHAQWLKDREEKLKKLELEQEWKPPALQSLQRRRKMQRMGRQRNSSHSSPGSEPDSTTVDSPLPDLSKMDVVREEPPDTPPKLRVLAPVTLVMTTPTPSSPLLTSLLKSPSPAPSSQASSILHSAITAQRGASPTIASLLGSAPGAVPPPPTTVSPSLKNLVSSAIGNASEEHLKPQNTSPSAVPVSSDHEELRRDQEIVKDNGNGNGLMAMNIIEDVKETVQCDELTDEAVLEMVLAAEDSVCVQPVTVPIASSTEDAKVHSSWVRTLDFDSEAKKQNGGDDNGSVQQKDAITADNKTPQEEVVCNDEKEMEVERSDRNVSQATESDMRQDNEEVIFEVINTENGKEGSVEVGSEVEVATKSEEEDLLENFIENTPEQNRVVITEITHEVFNIQEVEVPMSETVAEEVEIGGDESQDDPLVPELGGISEQQVLEVIVGPETSDTSQELTIELPEKGYDDAKDYDIAENKQKPTEKKFKEASRCSDVTRKFQQIFVDSAETGQQGRANKKKHESTSESNEANDEGDKKLSDIVLEERKKQDKHKTEEEKLRSKKKKHSKGKKKKHSREKRSDSKNKLKEIDSKPDFKPSEKIEIQNLVDETKEKEKHDSKESAKKRDDNTQIEIVKNDAAKEDKQTNAKDVSPEHVKTKDTSQKVSEPVEKDQNGKETANQLESSNVIDKKKKDFGKEIEPELRETESSKDVSLGSKESASKKEKLQKPNRNHRKGQDVKTDDTTGTEELPHKDKKELVRRDSSKDLTRKKSENSDSEASELLKESTPGSVAPTDEEDEKPLAEIVDEKKLQLVSIMLAKEEKSTRSVEPQSGEEDKTSDAEASKTVNRKQRAATSTPIDSVPNSPAPSFTTDEEREHKAWKKAIMLLYNRLATHKYASLFLRPITNDLAPGYSSYIYKPVDLQMIKKNIENGIIRTTTEFQKEVMRMFKNAIMYNKSLHDVHLMALEMQEECLQHIEEFVATQMLVASVGETPSRRETRTMDAYKQREFLRSPRPSSHEDSEMIKPTKRKRNDTSSDTPDHTPKRKAAED